MTADRMYCEIYRCHMSVAACVARQENARKYIESKTWGPGRVKPGALDINCQNCKQGRRLVAAYGSEGKEIMENQGKLDEDQGKDESATQPADKHPRPTCRCIERPMMNEKDKGEVETRICSQANCEFKGKPQPIENFKIHPRFGTRFKMCDSCLTKRKQIGQQRRHEKKKDDHPAKKNTASQGDTLQTGTSKPPELTESKTHVYFPRERMLENLLDGLPEVLKTIEETAHEQERTPIAQVRYLLKTDYRITGTDAENE